MAAEHGHHGGDTLIAIVKDEAIAEQIRGFSDENEFSLANIQVRQSPLDEATAIVNGGAGIVVIEAGEDNDANIERLEKLCHYIKAGGAFIAIIDDPSANTVRRLFRSGVTDVLPTPVAPSELIAALATASQSQAAAPVADGKIISIMKTAGGVGGTTVAINLAREMTDLIDGSVAIVDLDVQFGSVGLALDVQPRMTIADAIRADDRLDPTLIRSVMVQHVSGVHVMTAPTAIAPLDVVRSDFIANFCKYLKQSYDIVILEYATAWTHWIIEALEQSDLIVPVIETSVRSADGANRMVRGFKDFGLDKPPLFPVANKLVKGPNTKDRLRQLGNIFGAAPEGLVRLDEKVAAEAADLGRCFKDVNASAAVNQDFNNFARKALTRLGVNAIADEAGGRKSSFVSRLPILGGKS